MKPTRQPLLSLEAWKAAKSAGPVAVRQTFEIEKSDGGPTFVMSTASEDRVGDTIAQAGWRLDSFKANPVLLWGHDSFSPPVGRVTSAVVEDGKLKAKGVEFVPKEVSEFAWSIGRMVELGFVKAVSVGFRPLKWAFNERGGVDFTEQELLELSLVSVPANPEALNEAKGLDVGLVDRWAADLLVRDRDGLALDQAKAWLGARAKALQAPPADEVDDGPLPEIVSLAEALAANTRALTEHTVELRALREFVSKSFAGHGARLPTVDAVVAAVRAKL